MTVLPVICAALIAMGFSYCAGINVAHGRRALAAINAATALILILEAMVIMWVVKP